MSHSCVLPHGIGSCVELESGEYLLTISSGVGDVSISMTTDFCPFCGERAAQPATLRPVALGLSGGRNE